MTLHLLLMILLWSFVVIFTVALLIITYILGRKSIKDNIANGAVFVLTGHSIAKPVKAKLTEATKLGCSYTYKDKAVFVPYDYREDFYCNHRAIFVNHIGQLIASPFYDDIELSTDEKDNLIYELVTGHIGADGMRALQGKIKVNYIIIGIIIVAIVAMAMFGYNYYQSSSKQQQAQTTQQQMPSQPSNIQITEIE